MTNMYHWFYILSLVLQSGNYCKKEPVVECIEIIHVYVCILRIHWVISLYEIFVYSRQWFYASLINIFTCKYVIVREGCIMLLWYEMIRYDMIFLWHCLILLFYILQGVSILLLLQIKPHTRSLCLDLIATQHNPGNKNGAPSEEICQRHSQPLWGIDSITYSVIVVELPSHVTYKFPTTGPRTFSPDLYVAICAYTVVCFCVSCTVFHIFSHHIWYCCVTLWITSLYNHVMFII